ncbi:MAG TPA: UvrB/UvrC motif-containing protein [Clostridia bacterium]|nr:UvrB/UvrC motif-containing protein [Clostridia bacterium]
MLCDRCGKNEATTYLKEVINGNVKELHLCSRCAEQLGYDNVFGSFNPFDMLGVNVGNFLGGFFSQSLPEQTSESSKKCSFCGTTFEDLAKTAKAGCANCYSEFYQEILPSLQRIHGKTRHVGKIPGRAGKELKLRRELNTLKQKLNDAVSAQEYEQAAQLRDEIKELEKKVQGE